MQKNTALTSFPPSELMAIMYCFVIIHVLRTFKVILFKKARNSAIMLALASALAIPSAQAKTEIEICIKKDNHKICYTYTVEE